MRHPQPTDLWHFTCDHSAPAIRASGLLLTGAELAHQPEWAWHSRLVWLTDMADPRPAAALGLDRNRQRLTACDRTRHRFRVLDLAGCVWWPVWRREHQLSQALEWAEGARPVHWWVSPGPVPVEEA